MADYIIDFEQRCHRIKKYNMTLPDSVSVQAVGYSLSRREKQATCAYGMPGSKVFINEVIAQEDLWREDARFAKWNTAKSGCSFLHRTTTRERETERNISKCSTKTSLPGTNPLDKFGKWSRCAVCQSTFHWAKDCPHKKNDQVKLTEDENADEVNITLFTNDPMSDCEIFMTESQAS